MDRKIRLVMSLIIFWGVKCFFVLLLFFLLKWWISFLKIVFMEWLFRVESILLLFMFCIGLGLRLIWELRNFFNRCLRMFVLINVGIWLWNLNLLRIF